MLTVENFAKSATAFKKKKNKYIQPRVLQGSH